ncbi:AraC family transcriptional regulator [Dyadobacter sp. 676]|uniref:AraC family transcriptional regulator n=1 Tax=Dyadobacter sp. 676 TaxID=3088362 RepID=A0AAU8FH86_9BACT
MKEPGNLSDSVWQVSLPYISHSKTVVAHRHYCYKVAVSLDHQIECAVHGCVHAAMKGFVVNSNAAHQCSSPDGPVLNNLIEPRSPWGQKIREIMGEKEFVRFEEILDVSRLDPILPKNHQALDSSELIPHINTLMASITGAGARETALVDPRASRIVAFIAENLTRDITQRDIVDLTCLSFSRTRHLFAEAVGIPLSRYILWQRLRATLKTVIETGEPVSKVCRDYRFTDISHFHKTFKGIFGLNPSTFLLECRLIL